MNPGRIAELSRRGVVAVSGPDAVTFLDNLFTSDVPAALGGAAYGALLSPQGKILFDFIAVNDGNRILIDLPRIQVADFVKRLGFYRLRAKVEIADISDDHIAVAAWGSDTAPILDGVVVADPRLAALGWRAIVPAGADMAPDYEEATEAEYDAHRIALGVPEGGIDFAFGDTFPHDADMDQLAGINFTKGCYIGQEVVSRMEHRGTARRRFVIAASSAPLPATGTPVTANDKPIGTLGSHTGSAAVALVRLDRAKEAMDAHTPIIAAGTPLTLTLPPWAKFGWPAPATASED
ncbi:MAG TPA: folate-binding protein [Bauldia sp.]|nr:folate-binding protein [Bauldia sp.]